jgi:hypothetical protein
MNLGLNVIESGRSESLDLKKFLWINDSPKTRN